MKFYVFLDWIAEGRSARIHRGDCRFCNEGTGIRESRNEKECVWIDAGFDSIDEASSAAIERLPGTTVKRCKHCL